MRINSHIGTRHAIIFASIKTKLNMRITVQLLILLCVLMVEIIRFEYNHNYQQYRELRTVNNCAILLDITDLRA